MKSAIVICLLSVAALTLARPGELYTDRYDNVDLDEVLSSDRLLKGYFDCIVDKGKCTADGKELKSHMIDALETECSKCTEVQKNGTRRVIKHLINNKPELWEEAVNKYDPEKKYTHKYEKELREIKA